MNEPAVGAWMACRWCDTLHQRVDPPPGQVLRCVACGAPLHGERGGGPGSAVAVALAGLLLFLPANLMPVMTVSLLGDTHQTTLAGGALSLWQAGFPMVSALVLLVGVVLPLLKLSCVLYVAAPLARGRVAPGAREAFRLHEHFTEWGMLEVYLLGLLIAVVKLREIVEIETGAGLLCLGGAVLLVVALTVTLDPEDIWRRMRDAKPWA